MADYLLDTNILDYWYDTSKLEHTKVITCVNAVRKPDPVTQYVPRLFISIVTLGEIEYGHRVAYRPDTAKQAAFSKFVREQCPVALDMNKHVVEQYGEMRAWLFNNYGPNSKKSKAKRAEELVDPATSKELGFQENDIWIAAQAWTHNLTLVTHDSHGNFGKVLKHFASEINVKTGRLDSFPRRIEKKQKKE